MNVRAYAKINLGLHVVRKRADGFHDIETIFYRVNLFDELTIEPSAAAISLTCDLPSIPRDERNLCWKAIELLRTELGVKKGAALHLRKKIPVGAGLGGGSADAAAVLNALPKIWNISVDAATLASVALEIGSDVPFFLHNRNAYAEGRGEKLSFVRIPLPYWIVLITPGVHVSTGWAYDELSTRMKLRGTAGGFYDSSTCSVARVEDLMTNDFEDVVFAAYPAIAGVKDKLISLGASYALMSGSGSSVYGLFDNEEKARQAAAQFREGHFVSLTEPNFIPSF